MYFQNVVVSLFAVQFGTFMGFYLTHCHKRVFFTLYIIRTPFLLIWKCVFEKNLSFQSYENVDLI